MSNQKSKYNPRKKRQVLKSTVPYAIVVIFISCIITYLWTYSEIDETLNELETQQRILVELNDDISNLKDNIEYLTRVDVLTARAKNDLGMVFTTPETVAIYVDESILSDK